MKELGLQRVSVESYNHVGPNVEMYVCQVRIVSILMHVTTELLRLLLRYNSLP